MSSKLVLSFLLIRLYKSHSNLLQINDGKILGKLEHTVENKIPFFSFRGIPYARPPIGELRFKSPIKNEKWSNILDTTKDKLPCLQNSANNSEDCLYINVYTPSLTTKNLPVMLWIFGGGFNFGSSNYEDYSPDYLLEENVVFVSFNYRLNVFGFLSTGDWECPGNFGLKDQILAMKWVKENIKFFGGNPEKITVFGQSAGAASIAYLLQSDKTKELFNAAILESGSSLCLWSLNQKSNDMAMKLADILNIKAENTTEFMSVLRNKSSDELIEASTKIATMYLMADSLEGIPWSPVIEPEHVDAIITEKSHELLKNGHFNNVPILMGFNSNEANVLQEIPSIFRLYLIYYDIRYENLAPVNLTRDENIKIIAAQKIKEYYFGNKSLTTQIECVIKFISDDLFNRPIRETVSLFSQKNPVYFYRFAYEGDLSGVVNREIPGVGHTEELSYIFRSPVNSSSIFDKITRSRLVKMWTNFAKYHNPTPKKETLLQNVIWPLANSSIISDDIVFMNIDKNLQILKNPNKKNMKFFEEIYKIYGDPPFATY